MSPIRHFLEQHLHAIFSSDLAAYHATTHPDLTLYEWYITPHRIDGLPFHDFIMSEAGRADSVAAPLVVEPGAGGAPATEKPRTRFDIANYAEQVYGDTAICSYTLLISQATRQGVQVLSYHESRVIHRFAEGYKVVHVHKSPAWKAPFQAPSD